MRGPARVAAGSLSFKELLAAKHPTAWVEFENDLISEEQLLSMFFADGRQFDGAALVQHMVSGASGRVVVGPEPAAAAAPLIALSLAPACTYALAHRCCSPPLLLPPGSAL